MRKNKSNLDAAVHKVVKGYHRGGDEEDRFSKIVKDQYERDIEPPGPGINYYKELENQQKENSKKVPFENIELCNFIILWDEKGQDTECPCGGTLNYQSKLPVKFRKNGIMQTVYVDGKVCKDCGRKFVVKELIEEAIKNETIK